MRLIPVSTLGAGRINEQAELLVRVLILLMNFLCCLSGLVGGLFALLSGFRGRFLRFALSLSD